MRHLRWEALKLGFECNVRKGKGLWILDVGSRRYMKENSMIPSLPKKWSWKYINACLVNVNARVCVGNM